MIKKIILLSLFVITISSISFAEDFLLSSPVLEPGKILGIEQVFLGFGCTGKNISPALSWKDAPADTKSFAITVYDPDAPTGSGWWHWIIFNIPATVNDLKENAGNPSLKLTPEGSIQSITDYGKPGFGGACPPEGDKPHRYIFTLYALDMEKLPLDANASGAMVGFYLNQHALAKATLTAYYSR
ncbi:MAG: YbhB/YbcL family Raf kinase inhibitor-like protein [Proteobacteria bacterium]|nr:YbhB/YbcL family Raf kinase inhibitor-like protein [Pseudomonadota bacterium]